VIFFADESVERQIVERLRELGHYVEYVAEMAPGLTDDAVLEAAAQRDAVLITADKDFGELAVRQAKSARGILLVRAAGLRLQAKAGLVAQAVAEHGAELGGAFAVVSPGAIRIRRLRR
jgi:predicted nuclease of predicted toxin-antitoxin system